MVSGDVYHFDSGSTISGIHPNRCPTVCNNRSVYAREKHERNPLSLTIWIDGVVHPDAFQKTTYRCYFYFWSP